MTAELTLLDLVVMLLWAAAAGYAIGWMRGWAAGVADEKKRLVRSIMSRSVDE